MRLVDAALDWALEHDVAVFPCNADKSPRTPRGFHDATTDGDVIESWDWEGGMIGAAIPEGTIVVDVDPRNGGDKTLDALAHDLPPTRRVRTKSGGWHYYLAVPEGVSLRGSLGPGIDIKRPGKGYVVVPPSEGYAEDNDLPAYRAPAWLLDELTVPEKPEGADEASDAKFFPWEDGTAYGLAALERELGRLATAAEGGRNDMLNRASFAASQLAAGGELCGVHARDSLLEVAERIGLERREAEATIRSGWEAGEQEPRQAPQTDTSTLDGMQTTPVSLNDPHHPADESRFWVDWEVDCAIPVGPAGGVSVDGGSAGAEPRPSAHAHVTVACASDGCNGPMNAVTAVVLLPVSWVCVVGAMIFGNCHS